MSGISVAVVGGGAAAVCVVEALAWSQGEPGHLTVFEPSPNLWRGRAYQVDTEAVRVNIPSTGMSVRAGDPRHFVRWLTTRDRLGEGGDDFDTYSGARFLPRSVFGAYLEQTAYAALDELRGKGWRIDLVGATVTRAELAGRRVALSTSDGDAGVFDHVVLCVGVGVPEDVYGLTGSPDFVPDPYPAVSKLAEVDERHDVAIIGSGLTAVDTVMCLASNGHKGRIRMLSRRGVLPAVRQRPLGLKLRHAARDAVHALARDRRTVALEEVAALVVAELEEAGADLDLLRAEMAAVDGEPPVQRMRRQFAAVDSPDVGLRILQHAVPELGPYAWPLLNERDKDEVMRSYYRTIMSLCCPMPPRSAATLLRLVDAGQLEIGSGLASVTGRPGGGFSVVTHEGQAMTADTVINAVNTSADRIPASGRPLVESLTAVGAARINPYGGLHLDPATSRLLPDGAPHPGLYALGDIGFGTFFFTFGLPAVVDRATEIVSAMLAPATEPDRQEVV